MNDSVTETASTVAGQELRQFVERYERLEADMKRRRPNADPFLLERLAITKPFLDACIVSGFSLGASKSCLHIAQHALGFLGDNVGRLGIESTELHLDAVRHWGDIEGAGEHAPLPGRVRLGAQVTPEGGHPAFAIVKSAAQEMSTVAYAA